MKKFKCSCEFHIIEVDKRPLDLKGQKEDFIGLTIYEHRSGQTGKLFKRPRELGTVVLIGQEARDFKEYLK